MFERAEFVLLVLSISSIVLFILPNFSNPFNTGKLITGVIFTALLFLTKAIKKMISGNPSVTHGSFDLPVLLITASFAISTIVRTPNKLEAFWLPGITSFVVLAAFIYFAIIQLSSEGKRMLATALVTLGSIVAFISILVSMNVLQSMTFLPQILRATGFNPTGSILSSTIFLIVMVPLAISLIMHGALHKKAILGTMLAVIALGLVVNIFAIASQKMSLPGFTTSWIVSTEALKNNPVFGVGPGNYLSAFSRFLPLSYNLGDTWASRFSSAQNLYFTMLTENGILGIAVLLLFVYVTVQIFRKSHEHSASRVAASSLVVMLIMLALFPVSPVLFVILFAVAALIGKTKSIHFGVNPEAVDHAAYIKAPTIIVSLLLMALSIGAFVAVFTFARAESIYARSLIAVSKNDGKLAYDLMKDAINAAPYVDRYHTSYAQINLALANAISQKKELTDDDKNTIAQLIQQAIREGKVSVVLNQERSNNWEVLASIYKAVIPLAKGADQFAIQSYSQAIALDPINPNLRVNLGGIFYAAKRYDDAADIFKLAVVAHPKFANARYNLALAYRELGQFDKALNEMTQVLPLLSQDSDDYKLAQKEIENLKSKQPKKNEAQSGTDLSAPTTPTTELDPKITLPEDATPPATPQNDSVQGAATASPSPSGAATPTP